MFLWNNRLWTRIELLRRLLNFFESIAVTDQASLHAWVKTASFETDWKNRVKGLGIAVFEWLKIRCGVDTIKPDIWVINFAKRVVGRKLSEQVLVDCFSNIAPLVGEKMTTLDVTIWFFEHNAMATTDSPGLRLIAWHTLQTELKEKLAQTEALNDFTWQVVLDDSHQLRYQASGLTMTPNRSWFGTDTATTANSNPKSKTKTNSNANAKTVPSKTSLRLHQSNWTEGLWLELHVCHDEALPIPLSAELQQHLADLNPDCDSGSGWEWDWNIVNDSQFIATLDMEQDMLMNPAMTLEELAVWVTQLVGITIDAMTQLTLNNS